MRGEPKAYRPLLSRFPALQALPIWPLATLPTPFHKLENVGKLLGHPNLYIKRDDLTHPIYGGNKARKFEFILGKLFESGITDVLTAGGLGSNHNLATSFFLKDQNVTTHLFFFWQPFTKHCEQVLFNCWKNRSNMHYTRTYAGTFSSLLGFYLALKLKGRKPYILFPGASTMLGNLGYANAMLELKEQVEEDGQPFFDAIFVPVGSCGTFAGLLAGKRIANLKVKIFGVRVVSALVSNARVVKNQANHVLSFIERESGERLGRYTKAEINVLHEYIGKGYGYETKEGLEAIRLMAEKENIHLEQTYTGKTFAAVISYAREHKEEKILYWHTHALPLSSSPPFHSFRKHLPPTFHKINEKESLINQRVSFRAQSSLLKASV